MQRKNIAMALITVATLACVDSPTQPSLGSDVPARIGPPAPLYLAQDRVPGTLPTRYIVVVNDDVPDAVGLARELGRLHGFGVIVSWNTGLRFFAAEFPPAVVNALRLDPRVKYVAEDQKLQLGNTYTSPPSWGLDRIDQAHLPLNATYQDYLGGNTTLLTSHSYIIDTGIRYTHQDFQGRATPAFDYDSATSPRGSANFAVDCNGHGTHVAATVGGQTFGVSKLTQLHGVRVLDCSGTEPFTSVVASGVNWVTANAIAPAVANMSLWGGPNQPLDDAVRTSINAGITYVVIAGNASGASACNYSPARVAEAITVAATDINDQRSSFSNIGSCVDIFAPGTDIVSAWNSSDVATMTLSGTSMAAPHVTGTVANNIAWQPGVTPALVQNDIIRFATTGVVGNPGAGSPNRLLYSIYPFVILMTGPVEVACGGSGTYEMQGAGGVGPYSNFHGYLSHTYGDQFKTFTGTTFVEQAPIDGSSQNMLVIGQANDARGTAGEVDYATFMCEYF
jgi:subtilisin family serine protease